MIGNMAVRITADRPNFPLGTLFVRAGSAANIALVGVPVRPGVNVTALALRVENVDGATADYAARAIGGVWVVDVPAAHFATVGSVTGGVSVWATGTGADGETSRTWCVGVGDLEVLTADADAPAPAPGQTFWPLRMFDAAPASPTKYNAYIDGAALKIWNGTAWVEISGGSIAVDDSVTRTGANPVKSSGIWSAIWGALTELPAGVASLYDWCVAQLADKVPTSREVNGKALSGDVALTAADVGALPITGGTMTGPLQIPNITFASVNKVFRIAEFLGRLAISNMTDTILVFIPNVTNGTLALAAPNPTAGNLAALDANGNPTDSGTKPSDFASAADLRYLILGAIYNARDDFYILADRTVNLITASDETSIDIELPDAVTVGAVRYARDFILDVDNSANASDLALEFTALGVSYAFVPLEDDSVSEMMTIGAGERVRLYFTETSYFASGASLPLPVIQVARVTIGDFVTSTTTQGGN